MVRVPDDDPHEECLHLPRAAVGFPVEWRAREGFHLDDPGTWPKVEGRLEYVNGRIRYMPPCGGIQQDVASDVTAVLHAWVKAHPEFIVASNEAGIMIGDQVRAADAAIWRLADAGRTSGFRRVPPILAVEIAGEDEGEDVLREKASWYLDVGAKVVWLVLPEPREVLIVTPGSEVRLGLRDRLPPHVALPGLEPAVIDLFYQLERR